MAQEFVIKVNNILSLQDSGKLETQKVEDSEDPRPSNNTKRSGKKKKSLEDALTARFMVGSARKLLNSVQNEQLQNINMAIGQAAKYGFLSVRALSGDPSAIITLVVDVAAQAISAIQQEAMKEAAELNSVDEARYATGVLDLSGVSVSKNWWSQRYQYNR